MLPIRFKRIKHVQMLEKQDTDRLKLFLQTFGDRLFRQTGLLR